MTAAQQSDQIAWLRDSAPYFEDHRGKTMVIHLDADEPHAATTLAAARDLMLLHSLSVRLVLVFGLDPAAHIGRNLATEPTAQAPVLLDTDIDILHREAAVRAAALESALIQAARQSQLSAIQVSRGNFLTAKPIGIHRGVDHGRSADIRRVATQALANALLTNSIVLVGPMAMNAVGEWFFLDAERIAVELASRLSADKLIFFSRTSDMLGGEDGSRLGQLDLADARKLLGSKEQQVPQSHGLRKLRQALNACENGVNRSHLIDLEMDGALLLELFSRDGIGTMVSADQYDAIRPAVIADAPVLRLILEPLERKGTLIPRPLTKLSAEIGRFIVLERDQTIIGCAAVYSYPSDQMAELAALAIAPPYQKADRGDALLNAVKERARSTGATRLFALSTQTFDWFKERGFSEVSVDALPASRAADYDNSRNSKILMLELGI